MNQGVLIIGAGPAGLTAGLELLKAGMSAVTILEATRDIGGLSKTVNHQGNRIDIGGHRFFSKSDWVMDWWRDMLPVAMPDGVSDAQSFRLAYQGGEALLGSAAITARESERDVMLVRSRLSRIYFGGNFFDYPLKPGLDLALKMGPVKCAQFAGSYLWSSMRPIQPEETLEHFFVNRFGRQLYKQFFKEYTEKVWGVPCSDISAEWGAQRVKSLSIGKALKHAMRKLVSKQVSAEQTSLIESFLYPKYGPGQMWEAAAARFVRMGGRLLREQQVVEIRQSEGRVTGLTARTAQGELQQYGCDALVSTMPMRDLSLALRPAPPAPVLSVGRGLQYRDFITVGLLYRRLHKDSALCERNGRLVKDNWIYIQEPGVKVGRLQIFNNWSPYMVADESCTWVGLEFFARDDDELWALSDEAIKQLAIREMQQLKLGMADDVIDATVIRMPKAYPGYFGSAYQQFDILKDYLSGMPNLYLIGRNGMHRYNNQDHSMLSAKLAAQAICAGGAGREQVWTVNIDDDYHEEKQSS